MARSSTERLSEQLRSEDGRLEALQAIGAIEPVSREAAEALTDDIADALECETNAYTILQLLEQLRRFSAQHPATTAPAMEAVTRLVGEALKGLQGDDPAQNRRISKGTTILESIVEASDPERTVLEMDYEDIEPFIEHGNPEHRTLGYRLLGRTATREAIRILLQDFSHEIDRVTRAAEEGLAEARELAELSLADGGPVRRLDAIGAFAELYAEGEVEPSAAQLETIQRGIFELSGSAAGEDHQSLLTTVQTLCKCDTNLAGEIVAQAMETLRTNPGRLREMWELLGAAAEGRPPAVLDRADTLAKELTDVDPGALGPALDTIRIAAEGVSSVPASLARQVLGLSDHGDDDIALRAVEAVGAMGFYPVPERIEELAAGGGSRLAMQAADARDRLRNEVDRTPQFVRTLGRGGRTVGMFAGDAGDVHLKRRTEDGLWDDVDDGHLVEGIVGAVVERLERDENVPVVYPHHDPRELVLLAIAVTLGSPEQDRQVGVYSPGSRSHWGNKGEIRSLLREYGLSETADTVIRATPVPDVVTEAYVGGDGVTDNSDGEGPGRIVLSKRIAELTEVPDLDITVVNSISKAGIDLREELAGLEEAHPETTIVSAYSYYTENETKGRPRYGPPLGLESVLTVPGADVIDSVLDSAPDAAQGELRRHRGLQDGMAGPEDGHWHLADEDLRSFGRPATVRIDHVDPGEIEELLDAIFEQSASLFEVEDAGAGGLIFSRQMFFERLPIPPEDFDDWVRARYAEGDRFVPPLIRERIGDVERKAGVVENLQAVQPLNKAEALLDRLRDELDRRNPLFERLKEHIDEAKEQGSRLAIFRAGVKQARMLEDVLVDRGLVTQEELESGAISVVSATDARRMDPHDTLLIFGNLHPENAAFYVHPRVERTVVVTYNRLWVGSIGRHADEFVELLNATVGDQGFEPYPEPELVGDTETETEKEVEEERPIDTSAAVSAEDGPPSEKSRAQIIADAMESASIAGYGEEAARYDRDVRYYLLETDDGERYIRTTDDRILRERSTADGTELHWTGPESLTEGDTVVAIPAEVREELWRSHLDSVYDDDGANAGAALENLQRWFDAIGQIWQAEQEALGGIGTVSEGAVYNHLHERLDEIDGFARTRGTVRTWFESIREADRPMDLVLNPALVIGPRFHKDIEAVGRAFGYEDLVSDAQTIERAMEGLRTMNRQEGHRYRESIREEVAAAGQTRAAEAATYHTLTEIREADSPSDLETESGASGAKSGLAEDEQIERVQDLIELAPTKNSELMDAWGFESGSNLYDFMTTELDGYFERNNNGLIVPTDAARALVQNDA